MAGGQDPAAERRRRQEVRLASFLSLKSSLSFFDFLNSDSMFEIEMNEISLMTLEVEIPSPNEVR